MEQFKTKNPKATHESIQSFKKEVPQISKLNQERKPQEIITHKNGKEDLTLDQEIERMQIADSGEFKTLPRHQSIDQANLNAYQQRMAENDRYLK